MALAMEGITDFNGLADKLKPTILSVVRPFTRNAALMRLEDQNSLVNLCLYKLHQAVNDFVYNPNLTEQHNDCRFVKMVKLYITRILIDNVYCLNLPSRKSRDPVLSVDDRDDNNDDDDYRPYEIPDRNSYTADKQAELNDLLNKLLHGISGQDRRIAIMLCEGHNAGQVAQSIGCDINTVNKVLRKKLRPRLSRFTGVKM